MNQQEHQNIQHQYKSVQEQIQNQSDQSEEEICLRIKNLDKQQYETFTADHSQSLVVVQNINHESVWDDYFHEQQKHGDIILGYINKRDTAKLEIFLNRFIVDVNGYKYIDNWSLLHFACNTNQWKIVQLLLKNGADVQAQTTMKRKPIHLAVLKNNLKMVDLLLEYKSSINTFDSQFNTPLHYALDLGYAELALIILKRSFVNTLIREHNYCKMSILDCCRDIKIVQYLNKPPSVFSQYGRVHKYKDENILRKCRKDVVQQFLENQSSFLMPILSKLDLSNYKKPIFHVSLKSRSNRYEKFAKISLKNYKIERLFGKIQCVKDYEKINKLGEGAFGKVFLVRKKRSSNYYALKCIDKQKVRVNKIKKYIFMERKILIDCNNPFIVKAHSFFQDTNNFYYVMEHCPGGDMQNLIRNTPHLTQQQVKNYAAEVALVLGYLHEKEILFRDLKPANVLIDKDGHIKLTDFGLAKQASVSYSILGSKAYLAPQMLLDSQHRQHNHTLDWYLFGVFIYELLFKTTPFYSQKEFELYNNIKNGKLSFPRSISKQCQSLLRGLLKTNPNSRIGFEDDLNQIQKHPWFANINWQHAKNKQLEVIKPSLNIQQLRLKTYIDENIFEDNNNEKMYNDWDYLDGYDDHSKSQKSSPYLPIL